MVAELGVQAQIHVRAAQQIDQLRHRQVAEHLRVKLGNVPDQLQDQSRLAGADPVPGRQLRGRVVTVYAAHQQQACADLLVQAGVDLAAEGLLERGGTAVAAAFDG